MPKHHEVRSGTAKPPFILEYSLIQGKDTTTAVEEEHPNSNIFVDINGRVQESRCAPEASLLAEFELSRLNKIHDLLWWAGRPVPARPLHRHIMLDRKIIITEQLDMHLVRTKSKIFVKPLPRCVLAYDLWALHIAPHKDLHEIACGLLLSYVWLVRWESDLQVAHEAGLLPKTITLVAWRAFTASFLKHVDPNTSEHFNKRFWYGELRLDRLNQLYRFSLRFRFRHLVFGYSLYPASYGSFLRSFCWVLIVFAYTSTLLAALQVGLAAATAPVSRTHPELLQTAAYNLSVCCAVALVAIGPVVSLLLFALFVYHMITTLRFRKLRRKLRESAMHDVTGRSP